MKRIVALGGTGIGPEVVDTTCELLVGAGFPVEIIKPPHGEAALKAHGHPVPEETRRLCHEADGVLFGAAGSDASRAVLAYLRWQQDAYANVRPVRHLPGAASPLARPEGIDLVIVRENSEGLYPAREGDLADLGRSVPGLRDSLGRRVSDHGAGTFAVKVVTRRGSERIARFACELARRRKAQGRPGTLTCVTKSDLLRRSDGLFQEVVEEVVKGFPELRYEHLYVDDAARRLVRDPRATDVLVTTNLYGDILSDLAAEAAGGLGLAPSGCLGDHWAYFESVHGSAPTLAGRGIANPTATILAAAMMLDHMGLEAEGQQLDDAVARVYREGGRLTPDQGGSATTRGFCEAVLEALRARVPAPGRSRGGKR